MYIIFNALNRVRLSPNVPMRVAKLAASVLLLAASTAHAQIGGPHDAARAAAKKAPVKAPASVSQRFEREGVAVDFSLTASPDAQGQNPGLVAGSDATVTFRLSDARTGAPVTGLHPTGWISSSTSPHAPNEAQCKDRIKTLAGGLLSTRAEIDLNSYVVLTINHDNTISFINPLVSFSKTKLENLISLPGAGADWALTRQKDLLYVTLPEQSAVAVIDTATRKLKGQVATGEKTRPVRVQLQPDGRYLWVGLDGSSKIAVIDAQAARLVTTLTVGEGLHNITFTADSSFAYVTNSASDTVSVIETQRFVKVADIKVAKTPVAVAYSSASKLVYVASVNGETISVIDPAKQQAVANVQVGRGVVALRFEPKGRYGFAVNQVGSTVSVIDAATNSLVGTTAVVKEPDQVVFSDEYAYVRGLGSEKFSLIELREVPSGKISPIYIQAGQRPATDVPKEIGVADMIAPVPGGDGAMIANTADAMFYYYTEGMMAPMGSFTNYKRRPRALLILDRSLSEVTPGVYSTPIKLTSAGRFDVPFILDQPRIINCFQLSVAESNDKAVKQQVAGSLLIEPLFKGAQFNMGERVKLRFKITDTDTRQPLAKLKDVRVLVFEPPGVWQQRQWAKEVGNGVYEVEQEFPNDGVFNVMVSIFSRGIEFSDLPFTVVAVEEKKASGQAKVNAN
jgi:YVTN family beta-propeller protein